MPWGLRRFHESGQTHFLTFSCYRREALFVAGSAKVVFEAALERVRKRHALRVYGYVVMPEHVHLLISEPERAMLAVALKSLKQGVSRRLIGEADHFWQKRYYDLNIRDY
jgi:putative transposase